MKSFDEWLDTTKLRGYMDENSLESAWEAGQQSKQAEVDELRKRIDEAIYDLQHIESAMWEEQVEHVLMILKGNKDEN